MASYRFPEDTAPTLLPKASSLINRLLYTRGITSYDEAEAFLNPDYEEQLHDPKLLHDVEKACERIETAMEDGETIAIYSDYDCDGIPGAVVLHDFFKAIGYEQFINYIPHRHYEGFGLSERGIDAVKEQGATLIITIDCGTSNVKEIAYAKEQGIDVIVTDHHEPPAELPAAVAIVNPKLGDYPFTELCGAAVVFKLAQVLLERGEYEVTRGQEKWWLDMVGVATVADMVPLIGENRVLASFGLTVLRKSRRPGLQQLLRKLRVDQRFLTEDDIGFTIGPRINAASRMDTPEDAFLMLAARDEAEAGARVDHLEKLNTARKTTVAQMTKDLHRRMEHLVEIPPVLVLGNPEWRPSLVGLSASKLSEEYNRPAFLWGKDGNGVFKGSCRSGGGVSVVKIMEAASEVFIEHGGHHYSGGFSVLDKHIYTLSERLNEALASLGEQAAVEEEVTIDEELSLDDVNQTLVEELARLAPYGANNHKPLFAFKDVTPRKVEQFGKGKEHLKLLYESVGGGLEAIAFFTHSEQFSKGPVSGGRHTLLAHVEQSFFMGRKQIRLRIVDIL